MMKRMTAMLAALMMLVAVFVGCDETSVGSTVETNPTAAPKMPASEEYEQVFEEAGIVTLDSMMVDQSYAAYVIVTEDEHVIRQEYGYLGDTVKTMIDTYFYYIPEGADEADVEAFKEEVRNAHDPVNDIVCGSVSYSDLACLNGGAYYVAKETYENTDEPDNVKALVEAGVVEEGADVVSMEMSDQAMLEQGCIKR